MRALAFLLALIPPALVILVIRAYLVRQAPYIDEWTLGVYIATRTEAGLLNWGDIAIRYGSHRIIFSNLTTAAFALLNNWNLSQMVYVQVVLSAVRWGLLAWLLANHIPRLLAPGLVMYSLMIFYPTQLHLWEYGFNTPWLYVQIFFLLALLALTTNEPGWKPLLLTILFAVCATFSIAVGLVSWVVLPVAALMIGYRDWRQGALWLAVMAGTLLLYFAPIAPNFERLDVLLPNFSSSVQLADLPTVLMGMAVYLSASVLFVDLTTAMWITGAGALVLGLNVWLIWRRRIISLPALASWVALAGFAIGSAALTMLGRASTLHPIDAGKQTRYFNISMNLWIAVVTLALLVMLHLLRKRRGPRWQRLLFLTMNGFTVVFVGVSLLFTSTQTMQFLRGSYGHGLIDPPRYPNAESDACFRDFPLYRDTGCFPTIYDAHQHSQPEFVYHLAVYRLALFADEPAVPILPDDAPVIVSAPSEWLNLYIREYMLPDVLQLHLTQPATWDDAAQFPRPLQNVFRSPDDRVTAEIGDFIAAYDRLWYLTTLEAAAFDRLVFRAAAQVDYSVSPVTIRVPRYADAQFSLYTIERP